MKHKGFTLVEILLTISLVSILFTWSALLLERGVASFSSISKRAPKTQEARFAMERMVRELLSVEAGPSGDLQNLQTDRVQFIDQWGLSSEFRLNNQTLFRGTDTLLTNVTGLTFTGYNSSNVQTQSGPQIRRIRISLTTLPQGQTAPLTLRTDVFLRTDMYENFQ